MYIDTRGIRNSVHTNLIVFVNMSGVKMVDAYENIDLEILTPQTCFLYDKEPNKHSMSGILPMTYFSILLINAMFVPSVPSDA